MGLLAIPQLELQIIILAMSNWDGKERRMSQNDHDLLIQIASDTKHTREWSVSHEKLDNERYLEQQKQNKSYNRVIWLGGGVLITVQAILTFIK